jgi:hypothetical protein
MTESLQEMFANNEVQFLKALRLPEFYPGQLPTAFQILRMQQAINAIQARLYLQTTAFEPLTPGELLQAETFNALMEPLASIRQNLGLKTQFNHLPLRAGDLLTLEQLNELVELINEAVERDIRDK